MGFGPPSGVVSSVCVFHQYYGQGESHPPWLIYEEYGYYSPFAWKTHRSLVATSSRSVQRVGEGLSRLSGLRLLFASQSSSVQALCCVEALGDAAGSQFDQVLGRHRFGGEQNRYGAWVGGLVVLVLSVGDSIEDQVTREALCSLLRIF